MNDTSRLNNILEQGEIIQWSGFPQPYSLFGESYKKSTIVSLGLALTWAVLLVGGYYALSITKGVEIQTPVMLFCVAVPLFVVWMYIADNKKVKRLSYVVTDKRAIVLSDKPISMPIADIDAIRVDEADNGDCHVRVGSAAFKTSSRKLPILAHRGEFIGEDTEKICKGLVFFNVRAEDEKKLRTLLKPTLSPETE